MYIFAFAPFNKDNVAQSFAALGRPRKTHSRFANTAKPIACFARESLFSLVSVFAIAAIDGIRLV